MFRRFSVNFAIFSILLDTFLIDTALFAAVQLRAPALSEYQRLTKRAFDLALSLFLLPFALPLMGLISLAIRMDSPGPVFYYAHRI